MLFKERHKFSAPVSQGTAFQGEGTIEAKALRHQRELVMFTEFILIDRQTTVGKGEISGGQKVKSPWARLRCLSPV